MGPASRARGLLGLAAACAASLLQPCAAGPYFDDSTLNVTQIAKQQPENQGLYLGSPAIVRMSNGDFIASHDFFGSACSGWGCSKVAATFTSSDNGTTWTPAGTVTPMYWATLFTRPGDAAVYIIGVQYDGGTAGRLNQIAISSSADYGQTWAPSVALTSSNLSYSTGPTPVLAWAGRLWRAFEHNVEPGWGKGYHEVVISAPMDPGVDLLQPASWALSGECAFSSVAPRVPSSWGRPGVEPGYGWLEGGAVEPPNATDPGIYVMLRVNSQPAANKAALLRLDSGQPGAPLTFVQWIDPFPGGMTKFDVRRDSASQPANGPTAPVTGLYVTLSNNIEDDSVSLPPTCSSVSKPNPAQPLPCCGFLEGCSIAGGAPSCLWCHAGARENLTLAVAPAPEGPWTVVAPVLWDDTGLPHFISLMNTGFQYVSWQFDGPDGQDIIAAVRAGYRGSNNYHNANRLLFKRVPNWRALPGVQAVLAGLRQGEGRDGPREEEGGQEQPEEAQLY